MCSSFVLLRLVIRRSIWSWRGATRWAGPEQWQELCTRCDLPDMDVLLTGYVEGWIPDGRITLGP